MLFIQVNDAFSLNLKQPAGKVSNLGCIVIICWANVFSFLALCMSENLKVGVFVKELFSA